MLRRSSIIALALFTALGATAVASTSASAGPLQKPPISPKLPLKGPIVFKPLPPGPPSLKPLPPHPLPPPIWWVKLHHPHYGGEIETVGRAPIVTAAPAGTCNCLIKQYLDNGSVLFTDLCTKEAAVATPNELQAQAQAPSEVPAEINR
jgi:hypothetical protein